MRRGGRFTAAVVVFGVCGLVPTVVHAADNGLVLGAADVPGYKSAGRGAGIARAALGTRPPALLRRAPAQGAGYRAGGRRLDVGVFTLKTGRAAASALNGLAHGARRLSIGDGGALRLRSARRATDATVILRVGRVLGAVTLHVPGGGAGAGATATEYARSLAARLRRVLGLTAWQRTLQGIGADGSITPQLALRAFAIAYRPLPGVPRPAGRQGTPESATLAMQLVARVWDQLTPAQQAAIDAALGAPHDAGSPRRARAATQTLTPDAGYQAIADHYAAIYAGKLPSAPPVTIRVFKASEEITTSNGGKALADALPVTAGGWWGAGKPAYCRVRVPPEGQAEDAKPFFQLIMAHETFHCFQFVLMADWRERSAWLIEGMADWAAVTVVPTTAAVGAGPYRAYLGSPAAALFARSYDATGFWAHADEIGSPGSLWSKIPAIVGSLDDPTAFVLAGGTQTPFVETWASAVWRLTGAGAAWHQLLPYDITYKELSIPATVISDTTTLAANPYALREYKVTRDTSAPLVAVLSTEGSMRAGTNHVDFGIVHVDWFCWGACKCPKGTTGSIPDHHDVPTVGLALAMNGGAEPAQALVTYHALSQFCRKPKPPKPPQGPAESNGDPHLTTLDGLHYDFQAAGEFVLMRSRSGDLEIQARQEPYASSRTVTVNTQLAMRVDGHRVTVSPGAAKDDPPVVSIDGAPTALADGAVVPVGAGTVARELDSSYVDVGWPDGSTVVVRPVGRWGVAARIALAETRRNAVSGLLGNFDGKPGNDLADRGGKSIAYHARRSDDWGFVERYRVAEEFEPGFFDALYGKVGDAWRIRQADSLFDYGPGQSTRTFTDRSIPLRPADPDALARARRTEAERICRERGVTEPGPLADCILDVAATGNPAFADDAAAAQQAAQVAWQRLRAGGGRSSQLSLLERAGGSLQLAFDELLPPTTSFRMAGVALDATGREGPEEPIDGLSGEPFLLTGPDGGVRALAAVIPSSAPSGIYQYARGGDGTWAPLGPVTTEGFSYLGRPDAVFLGDGTPITVSPTNGVARVYRGAGPANSGVSPTAALPDCAATSPALAADGATGALWIAWVQWDCPEIGVFVERLDPVTRGALEGPIKVPDSTWTARDGTQSYAETTSLDERLAFTGRPGQPGVYLAFAAGDPKRVRLWRVGDATTASIPRRKVDPGEVLLVAEPSGGRMWIGWSENERLWLQRTTSAGAPAGAPRPLDPPRDAKPPLSAHHWDIGTRADGLDVLYGYTRDGDTPGALWHARIAP